MAPFDIEDCVGNPKCTCSGSVHTVDSNDIQDCKAKCMAKIDCEFIFFTSSNKKCHQYSECTSTKTTDTSGVHFEKTGTLPRLNNTALIPVPYSPPRTLLGLGSGTPSVIKYGPGKACGSDDKETFATQVLLDGKPAPDPSKPHSWGKKGLTYSKCETMCVDAHDCKFFQFNADGSCFFFR